jgi:hypothetical protein
VAMDTKGGTRRLSEAVYEFKTGELGGTINLLDWMKHGVGTDVGTTDLSQGNAKTGALASVTFAEQKSVSSRLSWRAAPYQRMLGELGAAYVRGLKDHMPAKVAIKMIGDAGYEWDFITRMDLNTSADVDIKIVSTDKELQESELQKKSRQEALAAIGADPVLSPVVNPKWRAEQLLRSVADYDDVEIAEAMDTQAFGNKKSLARAAVAIQLICEGKKTEMYYDADISFMQKIISSAKEKQAKYPEHAIALTKYAMAHLQIVQENMNQKAMLIQQMQAMNPAGGIPAAPSAVPPSQPSNPAVQTPQAVPGGVTQAMNTANQA